MVLSVPSHTQSRGRKETHNMTAKPECFVFLGIRETMYVVEHEESIIKTNYDTLISNNHTFIHN